MKDKINAELFNSKQQTSSVWRYIKKIPETHFSLKKIYNFMEIHLMIFEAVCYENQNDTAICGSD